ncbi:TolB family protein [Chloroflexota bacterium]
MKNRWYQVIGILLSLVILISAGLVYPAVASAAGTGPDEALLPTGEWAQLGAEESHWYAFYYVGDGSQIQVRLQVEPDDGVEFSVWTPEQIWRWGLGEYVEPVGRSSVDPYAEGTLAWSGSFNTSGTYYLVVEHAVVEPTGSRAGTSYYQPDVNGTGVSLSEPTATSAPELTTVQQEAAAPGEPTGTLVFQTIYGGTFYTINADGTELQPITNGIDPVWSPSGEQIAFTRWEEPRGVWVVDADGADGTSGTEVRVFDWSETRYPSWSPDGEQIVFSRQHGSVSSAGGSRGRGSGGGGGVSATQAWQLGIVDYGDDSFWEPLPNSETNLTPDWSPAPLEGGTGGEQIVFAGNNGLVVQSVDGAESYQLTSDPKDTSPVWSPNGEQVAFVRRQHDHWEIYVVDADGSNLTRLTDTPAGPDGAAANSVSPAWSPDGNHIAFLTDRTDEWEIWVMETDGGNQEPLFDTELDALTLEYALAGERAIDWTW